MRVLVFASETDHNGQLVVDSLRREGHQASPRNGDYFDGSITQCDSVAIIHPQKNEAEIEAAYVRKGIPVAHYIGNHFAPPSGPAIHPTSSMADETDVPLVTEGAGEDEAMSETELRDEAFNLLNQGMKPKEVGELLGIPYQRIKRLPFTKTQQRALAKLNA